MVEWLESSIFKYYGFDWAAMVFTFLSINAFKHKKVSGFVYGAFSCVCWLSFNGLAGSLAGIIANLVFMVMHYNGFKHWREEDKEFEQN